MSPFDPLDLEALALDVWNASHLTGEFTLRSGRISREYFDKYLFEADPNLLFRVAGAMAPLIPENTQVLAALEMGAISLGTTLSKITGLPLRQVRKRRKGHGTNNLVEGGTVDRLRVCVIEDVVTSGGAIIASVTDLIEAGAYVKVCVAAIDREQGGSENLHRHKISLRTPLTMSLLRAAAENSSLAPAPSPGHVQTPAEGELGAGGRAG